MVLGDFRAVFWKNIDKSLSCYHQLDKWNIVSNKIQF